MDKLVTLSGASTLYKSARDEIKKVSTALNTIDENKVGYAVVEDGYLILKANEDSEDVIAKVSGIGGGGGGGGGGSTSMTLIQKDPKWLIKTIPEGTPAIANMSWSSYLDGMPTDNGILTIKVDNVTVKQTEIAQGDFSEDFSNYVSTGTNHSILVMVTDSYDNYRRLKYTVNYVAYTIESDFDASNPKEGSFLFTYRPSGEGIKTVHFKMDGVEFLTKEVEIDGRDDSITVPTTSVEHWHGSHILEVYFETTVGLSVITSNVLKYEIICVDPEDKTPIITSTFDDSTLTMQYSNVVIPYYVYNTEFLETNVTLLIDGEVYAELENVPRELQYWSYRFNDFKPYDEQAGGPTDPYVLTIQAGTASKSFNIYVQKLAVNVKAEEDNLVLFLSSEGKSNQKASDIGNWTYTTSTGEVIAAEFENFTWQSDGWINDESTDFTTVMRVKDKAKITIPYKPFDRTKAESRRLYGQTFEFDFKTTSVFDYNAELISCYSGDRKIGFNITAQEVFLNSSVNSVFSQYKEDEHVRISFVINKVSATESFIYSYINGIISKVVQFTENESFTQDPSVNITIGSTDAIIDIYKIRIYDKALDRFQMVSNWIADMQNSEDILKYYKENSIYKSNGRELDFDKVRGQLTNLPYIVVDIDSTTSTDGTVYVHSLPTRKGNKVLCDGYYVDPIDPYNSFSWKRGELDVQGTSSQAYPIKNFKLKIKKSDNYGKPGGNPMTDCSGFIMTEPTKNADHEVIFKKYSMRGYDQHETFVKGKEINGWEGNRSIPTNTFVFKADFASSEGANNVELVRFYNQLAAAREDIITPPQKEDSRYRIGIDGFPIVWFGKTGNNIDFIGKYNFNNHKGTDEVYGLDMHGEVISQDKKTKEWSRSIEGVPDESWEMCDNNTDLTLWKRTPGESNKTVIEKEDGTVVQYTDYLKDDTEEYSWVKDNSLNRYSLQAMFGGSYPQDRMSVDQYEVYQEYATIWAERYTSLDDWISVLRLKEVYNTGETLADSIREQRDFVMPFMKADIRNYFNLHEAQVQITPVEDLLGVGGKGEEVAHAFEVRFPGDWYDAWTEKGTELVKTQRFTELERWVSSTDPEQATNRPLYEIFDREPDFKITYGSDKYDTDNVSYRLAKFKNEFTYYFNAEATYLYYIFTEMFLMIDSRAKNSFPTYFAITESCYAMDKSDPTKHIFIKTEDTKKKDVDKKYFKKVGSDYEEVELEVGDSTLDGDGNPYYEWAMTEREKTDEVTWADGRVTQWPQGRWIWFPYDMDTAIGINNEGLLVFNYSLEDTEALIGDVVVPLGTPNSVPVYNGSTSVLWNNVRRVFGNELQKMYANLRTQSFQYDIIEKMYEDHQSLWPAAVFNEDAYYKYIKPLIETGEDRLGMCLGSKEQQRKWWMYNRFKFLDSKYETGDSLAYRISFRANGVANDKKIYITPYSDIYIKIKASEGWQSTPVKTYAKQKVGIFVDVDQLGDTEAYINSADQIMSIEKLNENLFISTFDIKSAKNLQYLDVSVPVNVLSMEHEYGGKVQEGEVYYQKIGEDSEGKPILRRYEDVTVGEDAIDNQGHWLYYKTSNKTLQALAFGANTLLRSVDASNCLALGAVGGKYSKPSVDLSSCEQLERCYFNRTRLTEVKLPEGGRLQEVVLPNSITTLNIEDQTRITRFEVLDDDGNFDTSNIKNLVIRDVNHYIQQIAIDIINDMTTGAGSSTSIDFRGFDITVPSIEALNTFINKLRTFTEFQLSGKITVDSDEIMSYDDYNVIKTYFSSIRIICKVRKTVIFKNVDGNVLYETYTDDLASDIGSVTYEGDTPLRNSTNDFRYDFDGEWSLEPDGEPVIDIVNNVDRDLVLYAHYDITPRYTIAFYSYDGSKLGDGEDTIKVTIDSKLQTYVDFDGTFPVAPSGPEFENVEFIGWGKAIYAGVDLEDTNEHTRILNIDSNINVYAQMDWTIKPNTIQLENTPVKYNYYSGDFFDKTGLEVSVEKIIPGGTRRVNATFTYNDVRFYDSDRSIDITVDENNILNLQIGMSLSLEVSKDPELGYQEADAEVNFDGIEFKVTFSDITEYTPENYQNYEIIDHVVDYEPEDFNSSSHAPQPSGDDDPVAAWASDIIFTYRNLSCPYTVYVILGDITDLNKCDWTFISRMCNSGQASSTWSVGDTKTVHVKYMEDSERMIYANEADWKVKILSFDHNIRYSEHNGVVFDKGDSHIYEYPEGKHTVTFMFAESTPVQAHGGEFYPMSMYFKSSLMYKNPESESANWRTAWDDTPGGGCPGQIYVHNLMYALPADLQAVIKEVTKCQAGFDYQDRMNNDNTYYDNKRGANKLVSQREKLFIPSMYEMYGVNRQNDTKWINVNESDGCARYDYFASHDTPQDRITSSQWTGSYTPLDSYLRTFVYQWANSFNALNNYYAFTNQNGLLVDSGTSMLTEYLNRGYLVCFNV